VGLEIYGTNTRLLGQLVPVRAGEETEVRFDLQLSLAAGTYHITAAVHDGVDHLDRCYHWIDGAAEFACPLTDRRFAGIVDLHARAMVATLRSRG
jgi:lipopolysaccharide transport system ATP-binding protein